MRGSGAPCHGGRRRPAGESRCRIAASRAPPRSRSPSPARSPPPRRRRAPPRRSRRSSRSWPATGSARRPQARLLVRRRPQRLLRAAPPGRRGASTSSGSRSAAGASRPCRRGDRRRAEGDGVWSRDRKWRAWVRDGDLFVKEAGRGAVRQLTAHARDRERPAVSRGRPARRLPARRRLPTRSTSTPARSRRSPTCASRRTPTSRRRAISPSASAGSSRRSSARGASRRRRGARPRGARRGPDAAARALVAGRGAVARSPPRCRRRRLARGRRRPRIRRPDAPDGDAGAAGRRDSMPVWVTESGYVEIAHGAPEGRHRPPETPKLALLDLAGHAPRPRPRRRCPGSPTIRSPSCARGPAPRAGRRRASRAPRRRRAAGPARSRCAAGLERRGRRASRCRSSPPTQGPLAGGGRPGDRPTLSPLERQSDPAWLGWRFDDFGWMRDGATLWFLSEESGWSHLYLRPLGGARRALTGGPFEIDDAASSRATARASWSPPTASIRGSRRSTGSTSRAASSTRLT